MNYQPTTAEEYRNVLQELEANEKYLKHELEKLRGSKARLQSYIRVPDILFGDGWELIKQHKLYPSTRIRIENHPWYTDTIIIEVCVDGSESYKRFTSSAQNTFGSKWKKKIVASILKFLDSQS